MTIFILCNGLDFHRLGITASRKMAHQAVNRNRAKRLFREAFRQSCPELEALGARYDWVFNARRSVLEVKLSVVVEELRRVIVRVIEDESKLRGRIDM